MVACTTFFIPGGAGFIGSALASRLLAHNKVVVYDKFLRDSIRYKSICSNPNLTIIKGDILDYALLKESMQGADIVVHCAAIAGVSTVTNNPLTTMQTNLTGSANVLNSAFETKSCKRVICFSTSEVFGSYALNVTEEDNAVVGRSGVARWTYAASKLAEEHFAMAYYMEKQLPVVIVRPFNVYGAGQVGGSAMHDFIIRAIHNDDIEIYGDGTQVRAWCYVDDMVDALLLIMTSDEAVGQSFNIGNPMELVNTVGLAKLIVKYTHSSSKIVFRENNGVDVQFRVPSIEKARKMLGYDPKIDLETGITKASAFFREIDTKA